MTELIERKKALKNICKYCSDPKCKENECMVFAGIKDTPTAEPEVRNGRWILCKDQSGVDNDNNNYAYFCSQCHYQDVHSTNAKVNFCWNCGCKMQDGGADNGNT